MIETMKMELIEGETVTRDHGSVQCPHLDHGTRTIIRE